MPNQIVENYGQVLSDALKTKTFAPVMAIFADEFEAKAKLMGRAYQFNSKEKFENFLINLPAGINVDIKEINERDKQFSLIVRMGIGMLKIPSEWLIRLNADDKIAYFEIK